MKSPVIVAFPISKISGDTLEHRSLYCRRLETLSDRLNRKRGYFGLRWQPANRSVAKAGAPAVTPLWSGRGSHKLSTISRALKSGVALRFPPQSKTSPVHGRLAQGRSGLGLRWQGAAATPLSPARAALELAVIFRAPESGVALRFPPQSKTRSGWRLPRSQAARSVVNNITRKMA